MAEAEFLLSFYHLRVMLGLPDGARVVSASPFAVFDDHGFLRVVAASPDLPAGAGDGPARLEPRYDRVGPCGKFLGWAAPTAEELRRPPAPENANG